MNINFEIYTISASFKEKDGKLKMPPAQNFLNYEDAKKVVKQISEDFKSEDGEVIEHISETGVFDTIVRFHGKDGRSYMWQITKQYINHTF